MGGGRRLNGNSRLRTLFVENFKLNFVRFKQFLRFFTIRKSQVLNPKI